MKHAFSAVFIGWGAFINSYLLAHFIFKDKFDPLALLNHAAHYLTLLAVIAFFLALVFRVHWQILLWLLPGALAFGFWYGPNFLPKSDSDVKGIPLTAATYNVVGFIADPDETFAVIKEIDADLVSLQELRPTLENKLRTELSDTYPYQVSAVLQEFDGLALLSKFPIIESHIELANDLSEIDLSKPRYIRAVLDIHGREVVVYAFHAAYPPFNIPFYYDDSDQKVTIRNIVDRIEQEKYPVLLLCDCNFTPRTPQYGWLDAVLDDAFQEQGWGFGLTHPSKYFGRFRRVRIDYLWYSRDFVAVTAKVWPEAGTSDHYPVWGKFILRD